MICNNKKIISALFSMGYCNKINTESLILLAAEIPQFIKDIKAVELICVYGMISETLSYDILQGALTIVSDLKKILNPEGRVIGVRDYYKYALLIKRSEEIVNHYKAYMEIGKLLIQYQDKSINASELNMHIVDIVNARLRAMEELYRLIDDPRSGLSEDQKYVSKAIFEIQKILYNTYKDTVARTDAVLELKKIQEKLEHPDIKIPEALEYQSAIMGSIFASILLKYRCINSILKLIDLKDSKCIKRFLDLNANGGMIESSIKQLDQLKKIRYDDDSVKSTLRNNIAEIGQDMQEFQLLCHLDLKLCWEYTVLYEELQFTNILFPPLD